MSTVLRGAGYLTSIAEDGEAGWNALSLIRFDALITDYEMPRLTGLDLIRRMRASALNVPVILMSGRMPFDDSSIRPLITPGAVLRKPFSINDLMVKLTNLLIPMGSGAPLNAWQTLRVHGWNPPPDLALDELE